MVVYQEIKKLAWRTRRKSGNKLEWQEIWLLNLKKIKVITFEKHLCYWSQLVDDIFEDPRLALLRYFKTDRRTACQNMK